MWYNEVTRRATDEISLQNACLSITQSCLFCFVVQITTLVNAKEKPIRSERTLSALLRVGQAVNLAVERFVGVGEAIARDNPEIQREMTDACRDARNAGTYLMSPSLS